MSPSQAPAQTIPSIRGWFTAIKLLNLATVAAQGGTHLTLAVPALQRWAHQTHCTTSLPIQTITLCLPRISPPLSLSALRCLQTVLIWEGHHRGCCNLAAEVSEHLGTPCPLKLLQGSDSLLVNAYLAALGSQGCLCCCLCIAQERKKQPSESRVYKQIIFFLNNNQINKTLLAKTLLYFIKVPYLSKHGPKKKKNLQFCLQNFLCTSFSFPRKICSERKISLIVFLSLLT